MILPTYCNLCFTLIPLQTCPNLIVNNITKNGTTTFERNVSLTQYNTLFDSNACYTENKCENCSTYLCDILNNTDLNITMIPSRCPQSGNYTCDKTGLYFYDTYNITTYILAQCDMTCNINTKNTNLILFNLSQSVLIAEKHTNTKHATFTVPVIISVVIALIASCLYYRYTHKPFTALVLLS